MTHLQLPDTTALASPLPRGAVTPLTRIPSTCRERMLAQTQDGQRALAAQHLQAAGLSELYAPYEIRRPRCPHHVLLFTLAGEGSLSAAGPSLPLTPGSLCILPAGADHAYRAIGEWRLLWFHPAARKPWSRLVSGDHVVRPAHWMNELARLVEDFVTEAARQRPDSLWILESYAALFSRFLHRELHTDVSPVEMELRRRLDGLWQAVQEDPGRDWHVAELARRAALSRPHLHAVVRNLHGCTIMQMVSRIRMDVAAQLLLETGASLDDIAERVGYATPFSFSRAFRRYTGTPPATFRRTGSAGPAGRRTTAPQLQHGRS